MRSRDRRLLILREHSSSCGIHYTTGIRCIKSTNQVPLGRPASFGQRLTAVIIAFVGFVILTGFWIIRIGDKVEAAGGVQEVMDRIREMLAGPNDARLEHAFGDL